MLFPGSGLWLLNLFLVYTFTVQIVFSTWGTVFALYFLARARKRSKAKKAIASAS